MIGFRYHVVSIVAVLLALTVGLVLGTTVLQDPVMQRLSSDANETREQLAEMQEHRDLAQSRVAGADELLDAYAGEILGGRLDGVRVVLVEAPGAEDGVSSELIDRFDQAGATVTGQLRLTETYVDPEERVFLDELTTQLASGVDLPDGDAHRRAGTQLAHALLDPAGAEAEPGQGDTDAAVEESSAQLDAGTVVEGFDQAGLVTTVGDPQAGADIAVLVASGASAPTTDDSGAVDTSTDTDTAMLALGEALATVGASGAVVAGPPTTADRGLIERVYQAQTRITTVDSADTSAGAVATALAVASTVDGRLGRYGVGPYTESFLPAEVPEREPLAHDGADDSDEVEDT
ncbi:copper transporter [Lipingzhangella sp. LS1_29]|uniref:Copper transporter n=1 Tax=Lipingzhangella rawalii TaxID=2055835 RepID=A0ABU2H3R1_9ACTN|nr:copper transporter [Lipingzhangella rawalii]MDS1269490.1 copper transporter [Lipingzhangella rawalii]